ncbi:MAG: ComEA family DNA-binding protein [Oscillospiraceae bacterium]|nr:ComEA family DNA-binding protein [Oscillospiraceae bacterium]
MTKNDRIEKVLIASILTMFVLCIGLVLHDSVFNTENHSFFEEVSSSKAAGIYLVNINTADEEELTDLPGIGEKLAARIVEYREKNGEFSSLEDLCGVSGIGSKTVESIADLITY